MLRTLDPLELSISYLVWPGSVVYSLYRYLKVLPGITPYLDKNDFNKGWLVQNKNKDTSDVEWSVFVTLLTQFYLLFAFHFFSSQLCQILKPKLLPYVFIVSGAVAINIILSFQAFMLILLNVSIVLILHLKFHRLFSYLFLLVILFVICHPIMADVKQELFESDSFRGFLFDVAIVWLNARCLTFTCDRLDSPATKKYQHDHQLDQYDFLLSNAVPALSNQEFIRMFSYMFYLPTFFTGPINQYESFVKDLDSIQKWNFNRTLVYVSWSFKYLFWALALEFALHHFYSSAVQYYPSLIVHFDAWALAGFGYSLTALFYLKYFVIFGFAQVMARFDQIQTPPPPKCTSRIHSASYLWRHFDRGLYLWLSKYFYKPIIGDNWSVVNKACASFICFTNVAMWHRMEDAAIVWCAINFFMILIEQLAINYFESNSNRHKLNQLPTFVRERIVRLAAAPCFAIMIISNIYFLSNIDIGHYFFVRLLFRLPIPSIPLLIVMYFGCRLSQHRMEKENKANLVNQQA